MKLPDFTKNQDLNQQRLIYVENKYLLMFVT